MKNGQCFYLTTLLGAVFLLQGCSNRSGNDVWEDTKSAGRHVQRGFKTLTGYCPDSRQIQSREEFECIEDENCFPQGNFQDCDYQEMGGSSYSPQDFTNASDYYNIPLATPYNNNGDFVPLYDPNQELGQKNSPPSAISPGEEGGPIPGIQAFRDPSIHPQLAAVFRPIYFDYDSSFVKGSENLQTLHTIADFLRSHPKVYVFIEGHTDERGPQAYNLSLGSRRANTVRDTLINQGADPNRLFTISYGKERPVVLEQHEEGWSKNRRAEFKIYER